MQKKDSKKALKIRLDRLLVERGLVESRERGHALVLAGQVLVNGQKQNKAGKLGPGDAEVRVLGDALPYVSRGGMKLEAALREFNVDVSRKTALDAGASTGGFTDCLLQHGAAKVYAVDVGYGQLAWKLRQDPRVVTIERVNIRDMSPTLVAEPVDIAVIEVSFISFEKDVTAILNCMKVDSEIIALIKPQFEVGRENVGKGGIVRDEAARNAAVKRVEDFIRSLGLEVKGIIQSPITGQDGNVEFLIHAVKHE